MPAGRSNIGPLAAWPTPRLESAAAMAAVDIVHRTMAPQSVEMPLRFMGLSSALAAARGRNAVGRAGPDPPMIRRRTGCGSTMRIDADGRRSEDRKRVE